MLDADSPDRPAAIPSTSECTKAPRPLKSSHPSIPSFIHSPSLHPDTAPFASSSSATIIPENCFVIRFLLKVILSPKLLGQRYLSSISHKPAICLGELSRCLISFIISRHGRELPSAIPRNARHHYSQLTTLSSPSPDAFSFSPRLILLLRSCHFCLHPCHSR